MKAETLTPPIVEERINRISQKKAVWLATATHFTTDLYNGFLGPLMPLLVARLDISLALAGALVSVLSIFSSMLHPVAGFVADRLKRNYFLLLGPLIAGAFMSLIGLAQSYVALLVILSLSGIGTSLFHPQAAALVGQISRSRRGVSMSVFAMGGTLGVAVGPFVIIPLVSIWGMWASVFTVLPAIAILVIARPLLDISGVEPHRHVSPGLRINLRGLWPSISILYLTSMIRSTFIICFQSFMPLLLTARGESLFLGAASVTTLQICGAAGLLAGGFLSERISPRRLMQISYLAALPGAVLFLVLPSAIGLVFIGLASFFILASLPINILAGQSLLPRNASFVSGIMMGLAWGVGGLLATPIGAMADLFGLDNALLLVSLLVIPGFLIIRFSPGKIWIVKHEQPDASLEKD